jgi:hypothetical protein
MPTLRGCAAFQQDFLRATGSVVKIAGGWSRNAVRFAIACNEDAPAHSSKVCARLT